MSSLSDLIEPEAEPEAIADAEHPGTFDEEIRDMIPHSPRNRKFCIALQTFNYVYANKNTGSARCPEGARLYRCA